MLLYYGWRSALVFADRSAGRYVNIARHSPTGARTGISGATRYAFIKARLAVTTYFWIPRVARYAISQASQVIVVNSRS